MTKELTKDIIQWDVKSWSKALSYWDSNVEWNKIQRGLELGGREGGLSLWLALKGKTVVCSDLKDVQKTAEPLHKRHHVSTWIQRPDYNSYFVPLVNNIYK